MTRKNAQISSCLKASDFDKALQNVQAAIGGSRKKIGISEVYDSLIRKYQPSVDRSMLLGWLSTADQTLLLSDSDLNPDDPVAGSTVKYVTFYWVYNVSTVRFLPTRSKFN